MLNNKNILITGGTGSFGRAFVRKILAEHPGVRRLVIYSRDELKQYEMSLEFSPEVHRSLRYFIGDIRDASRLRRAMEGVDIVIHAAALKQVPSCEFHPMQAVRTNVLGAENVMNAAITCGVKRVVVLSTDKAVYPINAMGISKAMMEKVMVAASRTPLLPLVEHSILQQQPKLAGKQLQLNIDIAADESVMIADSVLLILLNNLLGNAFEYTVTGHINIAFKQQTLTVEDTGVGIDAAIRQRVFDSGVKGDNSQGMGVGLSLVKRLCDKWHIGYQINSDSSGTCVRLQFPQQ